MIFVIRRDLNMSNKWFVVHDKEDALTIGRMTGERFYTWDEGTRFTFRRSKRVENAFREMLKLNKEKK